MTHHYRGRRARRTCHACGREHEQHRGRPRKWCQKCSPPVAAVGKAAAAKAWRALNPDRVAARNEERRWASPWTRIRIR